MLIPPWFFVSIWFLSVRVLQHESHKDWDSALASLLTARQMAEHANNAPQISKCYFRLGNVLEKLGRAQDAIDVR